PVPHIRPNWPGEAIRLAVRMTHYRDPLDWTAQKLAQARAALDRFYRALDLPGDRSGEAAVPGAVREALEDDLNAPLAIAQLHELAGMINRATDDAERGRLQTQLRAAGMPAVRRSRLMAGTDRSRGGVTGGPAIILVEPQLGQNIGTAARAMLNCGLDDLRLVRPRDGWPSDKAINAASGADLVLHKARLYPDVGAAIADLSHVYASTARDRYMVKRELTPRRAAEEMHGFI